jgi:hypothetical protein
MCIYDPILKIDSPSSVPKNVKFIKNLEDIGWIPSETDLAIIANWGPDHFEAIKQANNLGFKRIVLEKPMTSSLGTLFELKEYINSNNLIVAVNQGWEHVQLGERIRALGFEHGLGYPIAVWINGGARCISTAGSHWIHLAISILQEEILSVSADADFDKINPRNSDLNFVDGNFNVRFANKKRLGINLSNMSSLYGELVVYWRDAIGRIDETMSIEIKKREPNRDYATIVTRYGNPELLVYSGSLFPTEDVFLSQLSNVCQFAISIDLHENQNVIRKHFQSAEVLLRLLISSILGKKISFHELIENEYLNLDMKIS